MDLATPDSLSPRGEKADLNETESGVGLSDAQLSPSRRQMLDLVNRLHSTGIRLSLASVAQGDVDLPQIAVIGNQSAGKSSLIESISGITLPRAAGTCTRCPTECLLKGSDSAWQCRVSLRFINGPDGAPLGQVRNQIFGPTIYNKAEVEDRIRRAQLAILNPSKPAEKFLGDNVDDFASVSELSFSRNVVSLSISGPGVADLSFCDLPGLIHSVSSGRGGGSGDIALVENLVTAYISKPSCIILLTVACETDFENQGAHHLAKVHDPDGKRTIGVLTKPDRIPAGEEESWISIIRNEREPLDNNWYCVKQPSSNELKSKISWSEARKRENDFFAGTTPWSELDPFYHRFLRTKNLVSKLSSVLSDLITRRLPELQEEIQRGISNTRSALRLLPPGPSSDPLNDIAALIHIFTSELGECTMGVPEKDGVIQSIHPAQREFRNAIRQTAPVFVPISRKQFRTRSLPPVNFLDNEEEAETGLKAEAQTPSSSNSLFSLRSGFPVPESDVSEEEDSGEIYIDEVFALANQWRTRELPGIYPFLVQKHYISKTTDKWKEPSLAYLQKVHGILAHQVNKLVSHRFGPVGKGLLEHRVRAIMLSHLRECLQHAEERVNWLQEVEDLPFTLNQHYLGDYKSKFMSYYKGMRESVVRDKTVFDQVKSYNEDPSSRSVKSFTDRQGRTTTEASPMAKAMAALAEVGITGVRPEDLLKLLPEDEMAPALNIMADVRSYFQVAYKRYADMVPLAVDHELVRGVARDVLRTLHVRLGISGEDGHRVAKELVEEDHHTANRREELTKKLERLEIANTELLELKV
ncbi:hypothetical protein NMY22_g4720 [Coprinellus aureogranulatus]|nr:hypothetical protein NMY22_g4720 [Coprinellus aureogranulatus]